MALCMARAHLLSKWKRILVFYSAAVRYSATGRAVRIAQHMYTITMFAVTTNDHEWAMAASQIINMSNLFLINDSSRQSRRYFLA